MSRDLEQARLALNQADARLYTYVALLESAMAMETLAETLGKHPGHGGTMADYAAWLRDLAQQMRTEALRD